ncbi:MAG: hypothetical protein WD513_07455 [Balneolaceae bacterium]
MSYPLIGCESGGTVGSGIDSNTDDVVVDSYDIAEAVVLNENTFSGRLTNTMAGYVVDPIYGTIRSSALLKPVISQAERDSILEDDKMFLKIVFRDEIIGNPSAQSHYDIYEAANVWRGTQLRYNQETPINFSNKVGEFQVTDEDSINVELSSDWTQNFANYFNNQLANRDSLYRNNFPGIAIVPSENNQNMRFIKTGREADQTDMVISSFFIQSPIDDVDEEEDDDEGEDEETEEDDGITILALRDWGSLFLRTDISQQNSDFVLHNTESVLEITPNVPFDQFTSTNIVNAQLILTKNKEFEQSDPDFERISPDLIQVHVFNELPNDLMAEIYIKDPNFFSVIEDDEDSFKIDITQFIMNQVYGEETGEKLYVTTQLIDGLLYSTQFYGLDAPDDLKPRIVITTIR